MNAPSMYRDKRIIWLAVQWKHPPYFCGITVQPHSDAPCQWSPFFFNFYEPTPNQLLPWTIPPLDYSTQTIPIPKVPTLDNSKFSIKFAWGQLSWLSHWWELFWGSHPSKVFQEKIIQVGFITPSQGLIALSLTVLVAQKASNKLSARCKGN